MPGAPCLRMDTSTPHTCVVRWQRPFVNGESKTNIPFIFEAGCNGEANGNLGETTHCASELSSDLGSSPFRELSAVRRVLRGSRERGVKDSKCGQDFQAHEIVVEFFRSLTAVMGTDLYAPAMTGPSPARRRPGMLEVKRIRLLDAGNRNAITIIMWRK